MSVYIYNNQKVVLLHHMRKNLGVDASGMFNKASNYLQLNKEFFVVPKKEAIKVIKGYGSANAVMLNREGCRKLLCMIASGKRSRLSKTVILRYLEETFGKTKEPTITITNETFVVDTVDIDKHLANMSTDNPLIQLIIEKAAEKVADRIMNRISA